MRLLKPIHMGDAAQVIRICAQWLKEDLGFRVVEYRIGNAFTGSIDILAVDAVRVYLITVNTGRLSDALMEALTGYRWFLENREFLDRVYHTDEISLLGPPTLLLLSPDFPPEIHSILLQGLKMEFRLFRYIVTGTEDDPDLYVEELAAHGLTESAGEMDLDKIRRDLGIEAAGLEDEEIRDFLRSMRAG
jgi:hypothetical protein